MGGTEDTGLDWIRGTRDLGLISYCLLLRTDYCVLCTTLRCVLRTEYVVSVHGVYDEILHSYVLGVT